MFPVGKLGDHEGGEHDDTSGDFPGRHGFPEEEATAYGGEDRFQAHDYRCQSRRSVFLPYDLEGKGDAHFQDGDVQYRDGTVEDRLKLYGFGKKRGDAGEYACQHEHHEGQLHRVDSFREIVDYQYLERVSYGTAQYETVPQLQGKALGDAKQIETCRRHGDADPCHLSYFFPHEEQEERNDDDAHGGDEPGLSCRRVDQSHLLERSGYEIGNASQQSAQP